MGMKRYLNIIYILYFFSLLKKLFFIMYNRVLLRLYGASIGKNLKIFNSILITIKPSGKLIIGQNCSIQSVSFFNPLIRGLYASIYVGSNATLILSDNVGISSAAIWCANNISIGANTKVGAGCIIMDNDAHNLDYKLRYNSCDDISKSKPIKIGSDVLIGANSIILKGVTIGTRTIIGAGSVVTKDIPSDCIAAGNPCRILKKINNDKI